MTSFAINKILVPLDFSNYSMEALEVALDIADGQQNRVTVLHVMDEPPPPQRYGRVTVLHDNWKKHKEQILEESLHAVEGMLIEAGALRDVERICVWGNPAQEIIHMAEDGDYDLIVMSTHGRTGLNRFLMGSVAERVVRHIYRKVLLLPRKRPSTH